MVKNLPAYAGDSGSIPELRISPRGVKANPMDRGAWRVIVKELDTT